MELNRRKFLVALGTFGLGAAIALKSCESEPQRVYSYNDSNGFISEIETLEPNSPKGIKLTWSPNSKDNSITIDREVYIEPVDGNYYRILLAVNSTTKQLPENVVAKGTILYEDKPADLERNKTLLEVSSSWQQLIQNYPTNASRETKSKLIQDFVNKYGLDIKNKVLDPK